MKTNNFFIFFLIITGLLNCTKSNVSIKKTITLELTSIKNHHLITGMKAAENLYLDDKSIRVYATDLNSSLFLLDGTGYQDLKIIKTLKHGAFMLGIEKGPSGNLYVANSTHDEKGWSKIGGSVCKVDPQLNSLTKITDEYRGINGLAIADNKLYFASSNFNMLFSKGAIYELDLIQQTAKPKVIVPKVGLANGLYYSSIDGNIYFSNLFKGVHAFSLHNPHSFQVYKPQKFMEAIDDFCTDAKGRLWMTDPGNSFVKCYDSAAGSLTRYVVKGVGQTSSCRIRIEKGQEILYVTELKTTTNVMKKVFDGRGIIALPLNELEKAGN